MFKDSVCIWVHAGNGGNGSASFRREKFEPKGGPDGGDGGQGASVLLRASSSYRTLSHLRNEQTFRAPHGSDGQKSKKHGAKGADIWIDLPAGTQVWDAQREVLLTDIREVGDTVRIAQGGRGGRGNTHFKSATRQTPFYAERGKPGESLYLRLDLRLIADVALVGFPNAGKSSLISVMTRAQSEVGVYPFTTVYPIVGAMRVGDFGPTLFLADIPGLLEGAHQGKGLGIDFLRHIERTRVLLFVLDLSMEMDVQVQFQKLCVELDAYSESSLLMRPFMVALNKQDLVTSAQAIQSVVHRFEAQGISVCVISALERTGLTPLQEQLARMVWEETSNA